MCLHRLNYTVTFIFYSDAWIVWACKPRFRIKIKLHRLFRVSVFGGGDYTGWTGGGCRTPICIAARWPCHFMWLSCLKNQFSILRINNISIRPISVSLWKIVVTFRGLILSHSLTSRGRFSASEMTYIVSSGALNSTHSLTPSAIYT